MAVFTRSRLILRLLQLPLMLSVLFKGIRIQGSLVAPRQSIRSLLEFSAHHKIIPKVMTYPLTAGGIEEAMQALREGKIRYRGVLVKAM